MNIMSNIAAMNANRNLKITQNNKAKTMEKLSSGYRINRAADDAAGLAISEKMRVQINGLNQASKNIQDGISLLQTAEGGMNEIHNMLQRMNTLANQASNGTYSNDDRAKLDLEFQQLKREISGVAENTNFNGIQLLNGDHSLGSVGDFTQISGSKILAGNIVVDDTNDTFIFNLDEGNFSITISHGNYSLGDFIKNINDELTDQDISLAAYISEGKLLFNHLLSGDRKINGISGNAVSHMVNIQEGSAADSYVVAGEALLTPSVTIVAGVNDTLTFSVEGIGYSITIAAGTYITPLYADPDTSPLATEINNQLTAQGIPIAAGYGGFVGSHPTLGQDIYSACLTLKGQVSSISNIGGTARDTILGDLWRDRATGGSPSNMLGASNITEGIEIVSGSNDELQLDIGGTRKTLILDAGSYTSADLISKLNNELGADGIVASVYNGKLMLTQENGISLSIGEGGLTKQLFFDYTEGEKTDSEPQGIAIQKGYQADDTLVLDMPNVTASSIGISNLSISSKSDASNSISTISNAINTVSSERAKLGAYQNRLEYTLNNVQNNVENLSAAHSRIRDADMAEQMTSLTKNQIISEAGQAMLAQANALPQNLLKLLNA